MEYKYRLEKIDDDGEIIVDELNTLPNLDALYWLLKGTLDDEAIIHLEEDTFVITIHQ